MNLFGPSDIPVVNEILDRQAEQEFSWHAVTFSPRQARAEDVRALALEHEERETARRETRFPARRLGT